jgi:DNA-binding transcriptional LysR family regulator
MQSIDLNLIVALDALLTTSSVTGAADRMHLSAPAMSRTLGRIREAIGDPILVRAGRRLVPTPRAEELRPQVRALVEQAQIVLRADRVEPGSVERVFTLRTADAFTGAFAAALVSAGRVEAPRVVLRFVPEGEEDVDALRDGRVHLDIGVIGPTGPEVKRQTLFRDRFVAVVRADHPWGRRRVDAARFAAATHISVSRRGRLRGPIDEALAARRLERPIGLVVASHTAAMMAAADSDLVASVPLHVAMRAKALGLAIRIVDLPVKTASPEVAQAWHPRFDADPAHRWLRDLVRGVCRGYAGKTSRT